MRGFVLFNYIISEKKSLINEILAGITVSLILVPTAISFAFISNVEPMTGLYSAFFLSLIAAIFGGRPGMISGVASALAVISGTIVNEYGVNYLYVAVILMGVFQILAGSFRLGKFMRLIPHSVMLGFVNGLAVIIFLSQLSHFQYTDLDGKELWYTGSTLWMMILLVGVTMVIIHFSPKIIRSIPAPLLAIIVITATVLAFGIETPLLKDVASIHGKLPQFSFPLITITLDSLKAIFTSAVALAVIGLIQSHMTLQFIDEITETRGHGNREFVGQGLANLVTGFFQGMGGCATIPLSIVNINSGGRRRISGVVASVCLLVYILFGYMLIEIIPLAALVGVMFMVALSTFEWSSFRLLGKIPKSDAFVILLVSVTTVITNIAFSVFLGAVISAFVFAWDKSKRIHVETITDKSGIKHYKINGPLFFASAKSFRKVFERKNDPHSIIIDFKNSRICDHSAIKAINLVLKNYQAHEKKVYLKNLSPDCKDALNKLGIGTKKNIL